MKYTIFIPMLPRRIITLAFTLSLLSPLVASATECPASSPEDPTERRKLAKEWFGTAETAENNGNDAEATRAYACSYKMVAHPYTAYNLGRVAERIGNNELAMKMFKAYLTLKPDAQDREEVKAKVKVLEDKLAAGKEVVPVESGTTPPEGETAPPEPEPEVLNPPPVPKPPAPPVITKTEPEPEPTERSHLIEWIVGGVGAAALVGGIATNLAARSKMSTCEAEATKGRLDTANKQCNAARPLAYTSYALFGVAALGAAVDATLLLVRGISSSSSDDSSVGLMLLPGGGGLSARGKF
jgi:outer membrane biosynthesis protein TonB